MYYVPKMHYILFYLALIALLFTYILFINYFLGPVSVENFNFQWPILYNFSSIPPPLWIFQTFQQVFHIFSRRPLAAIAFRKLSGL